MHHDSNKLVLGAVLLSSSFAANSASILFAHVGNYGSYVDDGNRIASMLSDAGHSVTTRFLDAGVYNDYSSFDQIFVYDLYTGSDNTAAQSQNYAGIANWYNTLSDKNLIVDSRIISSDIVWTNPAGMSAEDAWMQNYATQLDLRGGGLVLGTDHYSYQSGINTINDYIGINRFSTVVSSGQAVVDSGSSLFIDGLDACSAYPGESCINANSSGGLAPSNYQPNGQILYSQATIGGQTVVATSFNDHISAVPVPAAAWLFGSGLLGLIGVARRR